MMTPDVLSEWIIFYTFFATLNSEDLRINQSVYNIKPNILNYQNFNSTLQRKTNLRTPLNQQSCISRARATNQSITPIYIAMLPIGGMRRMLNVVIM